MNADSDREFWLEIRRGFLLIVGAIDKRFKVGKFEPPEKSLTGAGRYLNTDTSSKERD